MNPDIASVQAVLDPIFPGLMGVRLLEGAPDRVVAEMPVRSDLCTTGGILHGGAIMAFADTLGAVGTFLNLSGPIVLTLSLLLQRIILSWKYRLSTIHLLFSFVYVSVVMEVVLPLIYSRFIADPFDVLMYGSGIILFQMLLNKPAAFDSATVSLH